MHEGHIKDNQDRISNNAYLKTFMKPELLGGYNLAKNFKSPAPNKCNYDAYMKYIIEKLPPESPILFHLHPNASISCLTS